ncbi:MarR family winged helix-turn-helix transcriptional regulator [Mycobacterium sp.]|uniref:MarR family winged helix-turn-helix transcriptional regulator n=1 Tax=Mycobacterium sp. TaxID=1785 RepID=UPI003BAF9FC5
MMPLENNKPDADGLTPLADGLYRAIAACNSISRQNASNRAAAGGLTSRQLSILTTLVERGPLRTSQVAEYEGVRQATISTAIRSLESLGLAERSPDPTDNRSVLVEASTKGRAAQSAALANILATGAQMLCRLDQTDRDILAQAVAPLKRLFGQKVTLSGHHRFMAQPGEQWR